jgi:hypothetical protein
VSDEELKEKGRERAVTNLAAEAHREKGRRGERLLGTAGALGGLATGAALGKGRTGKVLSAGLGYAAGGRIGKAVGEEVDIRKNASAPVGLIRKIAQAQAFDELTQTPGPSTEQIMLHNRLDQVADVDLFKIAATIAPSLDPSALVPTPDPDALFQVYEELGGKYKLGFGSPMFNAQQMAGSPALAGGMSQRASTSMPMPQQAAPVQSPATSSPRSQTSGASMAGGSSQSSAPAAASSAPAASPAPSVSVSMG